MIAPLLLAPGSAVLVALAVLAGTFAAPMVTLRSRVAELTMPPGTGTETFTWLLLAVMVGVSASAALAGPLVEAGGWRLGVVLAVAVPLAALPAIFAGRRSAADRRTAIWYRKRKRIVRMDKLNYADAGPTARITRACLRKSTTTPVAKSSSSPPGG